MAAEVPVAEPGADHRNVQTEVGLVMSRYFGKLPDAADRPIFALAPRH